VRKQTEGDNRQRRRAAKEAKDAGVSPSQAGVTTGASKQPRHLKANTSHDERIESLDRGKLPSAGPDRADTRPASGRPEQEPR
jgi:hypothetical protein